MVTVLRLIASGGTRRDAQPGELDRRHRHRLAAAELLDLKTGTFRPDGSGG
jgi:hypothetical protein